MNDNVETNVEDPTSTLSAKRVNAELPADYYRQYLHAAGSHWWFRGRERVVKAVARSLIHDAKTMVIADVGSGPGGPTRAVFPRSCIVAIDLSPVPLQAYAAADGRLVADVTQLPCRSGTLAAVCAFDVLEHLEDDAGALLEWRRTLAPGGWLILTVPAYPQLWSQHDEVNGHHRRYHTQQLRRLLLTCKFTVARLTYFNTILLPGIALVRWAQRFVPARPLNSIPGHAWGAPQASRSTIPVGELDFQQRFPQWLECCCEAALRLEARWLRRHTLPMGVSICVVAQVPSGTNTKDTI